MHDGLGVVCSFQVNVDSHPHVGLGQKFLNPGMGVVSSIIKFGKSPPCLCQGMLVVNSIHLRALNPPPPISKICHLVGVI